MLPEVGTSNVKAPFMSVWVLFPVLEVIVTPAKFSSVFLSFTVPVIVFTCANAKEILREIRKKRVYNFLIKLRLVYKISYLQKYLATSV